MSPVIHGDIALSINTNTEIQPKQDNVQREFKQKSGVNTSNASPGRSLVSKHDKMFKMLEAKIIQRQMVLKHFPKLVKCITGFHVQLRIGLHCLPLLLKPQKVLIALLSNVNLKVQ